jgi:hypothetical protein
LFQCAKPFDCHEERQRRIAEHVYWKQANRSPLNFLAVDSHEPPGPL